LKDISCWIWLSIVCCMGIEELLLILYMQGLLTLTSPQYLFCTIFYHSYLVLKWWQCLMMYDVTFFREFECFKVMTKQSRKSRISYQVCPVAVFMNIIRKFWTNQVLSIVKFHSSLLSFSIPWTDVSTFVMCSYWSSWYIVQHQL
jgi:hypothetical protein